MRYAQTEKPDMVTFSAVLRTRSNNTPVAPAAMPPSTEARALLSFVSTDRAANVGRQVRIAEKWCGLMLRHDGG